jgi:hypothetical protein
LFYYFLEVFLVVLAAAFLAGAFFTVFFSYFTSALGSAFLVHTQSLFGGFTTK